MKNSAKGNSEVPYIPITENERQEMLEAIGVGDISELFREIPEDVRLKRDLRLPGPDTELETLAYFPRLASKNVNQDDYTSFLGGGIYDHYVPEVVSHITGRAEFYTSYTPYQAEVSQGMLQAIYEYQTLICRLTGMEVSNASMYDGATALAEAAIMACDVADRNEILISSAVSPFYRQTIETYTSGIGLDVVEVPIRDGATDMDILRSLVSESTGVVILQQPNFFGNIEPGTEVSEIAKARGSLFAVSADPISLGMLTPPGDYGADIVTGEGQSLGSSPSFGGPLLGLFATKRKHIYRLPGRLVGATHDTEGRRGYVLALQTREQHIRRERATSNICTNQTLMALAAAVFLSALGRDGLARLADLSFRKAHYARQQLTSLPGVLAPWDTPFFKEFVVQVGADVEELNTALLDQGIIGGLPLGSYYPDLSDCLLFSVTEKRTKEEIDRLISVVRDHVRKQRRTAHI